jgi:thiol-disulfide isomerase/thioredoxin
MMIKQLLILSLLSLIMIGNGCKSRNVQGVRSEKKGGTEELTSLDRKVDFIDEAGLQKLISERHGKILLLNIWATWCLPCIEEFPDLIKLYSSQGGETIEIVGISIDDPDDTASKVLPFLEKHAVPFKVYLAHFVKQDEFINSLDSTWKGAIPATFIYDSLGNQRFLMIGQSTFNQFKYKVGQLQPKRRVL